MTLNRLFHLPGIVAMLAYLGLAAGPLSAQTAFSPTTPAKHAIMIDFETDTVLMEKDADVRMPPASMSKLMTVYMVFERLKAGNLNLDDRLSVSKKAWRKGGSKMFVMVNTRVSIRELLHGIIVQSGNDACIVIAEGLAGSEEAFAEEMTRKAKEIGLTDSAFKNATGWPAEGHYMSARDIARLSSKLIREFPEYYPIFAEREYKYGGIKQGNRNPLLYKDFGADGLKTGHTEASGYGLAASAKRKDRRLVLVVNGLSSARERSSESARLLDWGFRETGSYALFKKGEEIAKADVWLGNAPDVPMVIDQPVTLTLPRKARRDMKVRVAYKNPIPAPIASGAPIGRVIVTVPGQKDREYPLIAGQDVGQLGFLGRLNAAADYLLFGRSGS